MAFCKACGAEVGGATFCPKCGASQGASAVPGCGSAVEQPVKDWRKMWRERLLRARMAYGTYISIDRQAAVCQISRGAVHRAEHRIFCRVVGILDHQRHANGDHRSVAFPHRSFELLFLAPVIGIGFIVIWIFMMVKAYKPRKIQAPRHREYGRRNG